MAGTRGKSLELVPSVCSLALRDVPVVPLSQKIKGKAQNSELPLKIVLIYHLTTKLTAGEKLETFSFSSEHRFPEGEYTKGSYTNSDPIYGTLPLEFSLPHKLVCFYSPQTVQSVSSNIFCILT